MTDLGMHQIGEVQRGGAIRQRLDVPFGGKGEDLVRKQIDLNRLEKLGRILDIFLLIEQLPQPGKL